MGLSCYGCGSSITPANETDEHIIINAAGGRLKSKKLICVDCNSRFGEGIDNALARQVNHMANMLMIERHRGEPQPIHGKTEAGVEYQLLVGGTPKMGKPVFDLKKEGDNTSYVIKARTESEFRKMLTGLKKKHPQLDLEEAMKHAKWNSVRLEEPVGVSVEVGGDDVFRAVCKCATNFFIYSGGDRSEITHLIPFINGDQKLNVVWMHYQDDLYNLGADEVFHLLHLVGSKADKTLYCYVDYFNTYKYLVLLNDNYLGDDMDLSYAFDVLQLNRIERRLNRLYNRETLLNFFTNRDANPFEKVTKSFDHTLTIGMRRQSEYQRELQLDNAINSTFAKYPKDLDVDEEMADKIIADLVKAITPILFPRMPVKKKK